MLNKKLVLCVTLLAGALGLATSASASAPGFYVGGQLGYGSPQYNKINTSIFSNDVADLTALGFATTTSASDRNGGIAGRIFAGYQIDPNWGLELGYTQFSNSESKANLTATSTPSSPVVGTLSESLKTTYKTNAVDFVVKGTLPIENGFSVYGKAGIAYLTANGTFNGSATGAPTIHLNADTQHRFMPTGTIGLQYDVTPQLAADVAYTRFQKTGNSNIPSANFFGVGLAYHFG